MAAFVLEPRGYDYTKLRRVRNFPQYCDLRDLHRAAIDGKIKFYQNFLEDVYGFCPYAVRKIERNSEHFVSDVEKGIEKWETRHVGDRQLYDITEAIKNQIDREGNVSIEIRDNLRQDYELNRAMQKLFGSAYGLDISDLIKHFTSTDDHKWRSALTNRNVDKLAEILSQDSDDLSTKIERIFTQSDESFVDQLVKKLLKKLRRDNSGFTSTLETILRYNNRYAKYINVVKRIHKKFPDETLELLAEQGFSGPLPYFKFCWQLFKNANVAVDLFKIASKIMVEAYNEVFRYFMSQISDDEDFYSHISENENLLVGSAVVGGSLEIYKDIDELVQGDHDDILASSMDNRFDIIDYVLYTFDEDRISKIMLMAMNSRNYALVEEMVKKGEYMLLEDAKTLEPAELNLYIDYVKKNSFGTDIDEYIQELRENNQQLSQGNVQPFLTIGRSIPLSSIFPSSESSSSSDSNYEPPNENDNDVGEEPQLEDPGVLALTNDLARFVVQRIEVGAPDMPSYEVYGLALSIVDDLYDEISGIPAAQYESESPLVADVEQVSTQFLFSNIDNRFQDMPEQAKTQLALRILLLAHDVIVDQWDQGADVENEAEDEDGEDDGYAHSDDDIELDVEYPGSEDSNSGGFGTSKTRAAPAA